MGPDPIPKKEHIANLEQSVYSAFSGDSRGGRGPAPPGAQSLLASGNPVIRSTIPMSASSQAALRLVEGSSMDKSKALDAALSQIERSFGKGSIMRLGK